jgi:metal-sulfur cluster biosynthetic enzyme
MVTEIEVRAALDQVTHPTFGLSLIALNMVRAVRMSAERIEVDLVMRVACPGCAARWPPRWVSTLKPKRISGARSR